MAEVLLFHHALGRTPGIIAFADALRAAGHVVHTPDLFDGRTFTSIPDGMAHIENAGFDTLRELGIRAADGLPDALVYIGFSFGVVPAQTLAQTRPGARGAVLCHACLPVSGEWAVGPWPAGVPVQVHGMDADPFFVGEGDVEEAREIVAAAADAELFLYPGSEHLFVDSSLPSYDPMAAAQLTGRVLELLARA